MNKDRTDGGFLDQNGGIQTPSVMSKKFERFNKPNGRMGSILKYFNRMPGNRDDNKLPLDGSTSTCSEPAKSKRKPSNVGQGDDQLIFPSTADVKQSSHS